MSAVSYQRAFNRIHSEYMEMPGLRLTVGQVERLTGVDAATCREVLEDLVRGRVLCRTSDGFYGRCSSDSRSRSRAGISARDVDSR